jgi:argininosuccinate synthase
MPLHEIIVHLNGVVGAYGWGRIDMVENRRVGIKSRETYEAPRWPGVDAGPRRPRVDLPRTRPGAREGPLEHRYAELIYDGFWFSPLKQALDSFIDSSQEFVTGEVRLALTPGVDGAGGQCFVVGRRAPKSLYDYGLATYDAADRFRHADSEGFVQLWGLSVKTWAARQGVKSTEGLSS